MENEFSVLSLVKSSAETSIIPYAISFLTAQFKKQRQKTIQNSIHANTVLTVIVFTLLPLLTQTEAAQEGATTDSLNAANVPFFFFFFCNSAHLFMKARASQKSAN